MSQNLMAALKRLSFAAQTTGGTAGPDAELMAAIQQAQEAIASAESPCGHPASLMLRSAETDEPLYCELCDDKSGRRDAETMEAELREQNAKYRAALAQIITEDPEGYFAAIAAKALA
jgi:hypothetical protein